jgi:hypothetical protein
MREEEHAWSYDKFYWGTKKSVQYIKYTCMKEEHTSAQFNSYEEEHTTNRTE